MEILALLDKTEICSYRSLLEALELRYSIRHLGEVYRARFRTRVRKRGESLQELAHNPENMALRTYPGASLMLP